MYGMRANLLKIKDESFRAAREFWDAQKRESGVTASAETLTIVLLVAGLGTSLWLERETLLRGLADLWIVSDPVTRADAVVVLGGGLKYRPPIAADLYKKGLVSKVLVSQLREPNRTALLKLGVPDAAIEMFGTENRNTSDEVRALKDWAEHTWIRCSLYQAKSSPPVECAGFFTGSFMGRLSVSRSHLLKRISSVQNGGRRVGD